MIGLRKHVTNSEFSQCITSISKAYGIINEILDAFHKLVSDNNSNIFRVAPLEDAHNPYLE